MKNDINNCSFAGSPEERVSAFIAHWYEQWSIAEKEMGDDSDYEFDFDYWRSLISIVDDTHFINGSCSGSKNSYSSDAKHDVNIEKITECDAHEKGALVFTEVYKEASKSSTYYVYDLVIDTDKNWKIVRIYTMFHPPKTSIIKADKHAEILAMSVEDAPLMDREEHIDLNENILFQGDRSITLPHLGEGVVTLEKIGSLRTKSGIIGILDLGYDIYDFEPLERKIKPGEYPVETVTIHDRVAGIRVKLSDSELPVKWYAANTPSGNGVYGVDAGNLAILDVASLMVGKRIAKEKVFDEWCLSGKPELVSITDNNDCVISSSGFGDGAYPAYWGFDDRGEVVSLYIDFMILVKENEDGLYESI